MRTPSRNFADDRGYAAIAKAVKSAIVASLQDNDGSANTTASSSPAPAGPPPTRTSLVPTAVASTSLPSAAVSAALQGQVDAEITEAAVSAVGRASPEPSFVRPSRDLPESLGAADVRLRPEQEIPEGRVDAGADSVRPTGGFPGVFLLALLVLSSAIALKALLPCGVPVAAHSRGTSGSLARRVQRRLWAALR